MRRSLGENTDTLVNNLNVLAERESIVKTCPSGGEKQDVEEGSALPTVTK